MDNNQNKQEQNSTLKANDVIPKNFNKDSTITQEEAQQVINEMMEAFLAKGGKPIIWKKPIYLLVLPTFLIISLLFFIVKFQPDLFFASLLILCTVFFAYIRYEEYATQEIAIYPFFLQYTYKSGLFKVETVDLVFGTSDFKYLQVEPYGVEHLYGLMKIFTYLKPKRWLSSSNVYIYNSERRAIKIPYVYQCELFKTYLVQKVDEFLMALNESYKSKTGVMINGHLYEEVNGKLQKINDVDVSSF